MESWADLDPAKVFIDSSALFAAAFSEHGSARDLLLSGLRGEQAIVVSSLVLQETERNLALKAHDRLPAFARLRSLLEPLVTDPAVELVRLVAQSIEAKDAPIVAGAIAARALYLATYDRRHLLNHRERIEAAFGLKVITPDQASRQLRET